MFYSKCGKILSNGSEIINCSDCPCGYFGLFGIKYRQYQFNWETYKYQPLCRWNYYLVIAEIKDNTITISKGSRKSFCMSIDRNLGKVGKITKMWDCTAYEDCVDYDWDNMDPQTGETPCLKYQKYWQCQQVVDFQVYNLLGCFQSLQALSNAMGCGEADANGNYPLVLEKDRNGNWVNTSVANNCINDTWNQFFCDKYLMNVKFNYSVLGVVAWQYTYAAFYEYAQYCDETTGQCWTIEDHQIGCGGQSYALIAPLDEKTAEVAIQTGGSWGIHGDYCYDKNQPCYKETCSDTASVISALPSTGANVLAILADRDMYGVYDNSAWYYNAKDTYAKTLDCVNSNNTCVDMEWTSSCWDNYYWDPSQATWIFRTAEFSISRIDSTPSNAVGVEVSLSWINNKWNHGKGYESETKTDKSIILQLAFDQVFKFPLHTNINSLSCIIAYACDGDTCNPCYWQCQPYCKSGGALENGGDQPQLLGETDTVRIEVIKYLYS